MSQVMHDDASDVSAALAGDAEAFARLYDRHAAVVLSLCRRRTLAEAEDALQETFIRAFRSLDQLDDPARVRPWLYGIARNVCSERRRAETRRSKHEAIAMTHAAALDGQPSRNGELDVEHRAEQLERLGAAIDRLNDDERLAVHLFYLQEDPAPVAMSTMNLSRSGFYKLLGRAREKLAALMTCGSQDHASKERLV